MKKIHLIILIKKIFLEMLRIKYRNYIFDYELFISLYLIVIYIYIYLLFCLSLDIMIFIGKKYRTYTYN